MKVRAFFYVWFIEHRTTASRSALSAVEWGQVSLPHRSGSDAFNNFPHRGQDGGQIICFVTFNMAATVLSSKNFREIISKINLSKVKWSCKLAKSRRFRFSARHFATDNKYFPVKRDCMLPEGCFKGNVAFVTGGGTGLGKGMVKMLSERGATVVISSRYTICSIFSDCKMLS